MKNRRARRNIENVSVQGSSTEANANESLEPIGDHTVNLIADLKDDVHFVDFKDAFNMCDMDTVASGKSQIVSPKVMQTIATSNATISLSKCSSR